MNEQKHRITRLSASDDDGRDATSPLYHRERMEGDAVWSGTEQQEELAAYLTGEYVNASCIPSAELAQHMLRSNLLFQPGPDDGKIIHAIERGRVAVKTVLTQNARLLTHETVTPYELFRAFNSAYGPDSAERLLLEVDLLVVRFNGDDRLQKSNGDRIDYTMALHGVVERRLISLNRPTWFISAWNYRSDHFGTTYGRGVSDLTRLIQDNFIEVRFGKIGQARVPTRHPSCLIVDPDTGESRIQGSRPSLLYEWYSEALRQSQKDASDETARRFSRTGDYDLDRIPPFPGWESNPELVDWCDARERKARNRARAAKQAANPRPTSIIMRGEAALQQMIAECEERQARRQGRLSKPAEITESWIGLVQTRTPAERESASPLSADVASQPSSESVAKQQPGSHSEILAP